MKGYYKTIKQLTIRILSVIMTAVMLVTFAACSRFESADTDTTVADATESDAAESGAEETEESLQLGVLPDGTYDKAAHTELSRRAAADGMVLLENKNNVLPLPAGTTVAMFGQAMINYVRGGGGSGEPNVMTAYA